jgi:hypothetical protein
MHTDTSQLPYTSDYPGDAKIIMEYATMIPKREKNTWRGKNEGKAGCTTIMLLSEVKIWVHLFAPVIYESQFVYQQLPHL